MSVFAEHIKYWHKVEPILILKYYTGGTIVFSVLAFISKYVYVWRPYRPWKEVLRVIYWHWAVIDWHHSHLQLIWHYITSVQSCQDLFVLVLKVALALSESKTSVIWKCSEEDDSSHCSPFVFVESRRWVINVLWHIV